MAANKDGWREVNLGASIGCIWEKGEREAVGEFEEYFCDGKDFVNLEEHVLELETSEKS